MTLDQFLDLLETTRDAGWFVSPEGYLRIFVKDGFTSEGEQQWDWPVSAVARLAGRDYHLVDWRKAGRFLGLSERDVEAIKGADQRHPDHAQLRLELERRLGIAETIEVLTKVEEQDAKIAAVQEDLKAPWQKDPNREYEQWSEYLQKGEVKA